MPPSQHIASTTVLYWRVCFHNELYLYSKSTGIVLWWMVWVQSLAHWTNHLKILYKSDGYVLNDTRFFLVQHFLQVYLDSTWECAWQIFLWKIYSIQILFVPDHILFSWCYILWVFYHSPIFFDLNIRYKDFSPVPILSSHVGKFGNFITLWFQIHRYIVSIKWLFIVPLMYISSNNFSIGHFFFSNYVSPI